MERWYSWEETPEETWDELDANPPPLALDRWDWTCHRLATPGNVQLRQGCREVVRLKDNNTIRASQGFSEGTHTWELGVLLGTRIGLVDGTFARWAQGGDAIGNQGADSFGVRVERARPSEDAVELHAYDGLSARRLVEQPPRLDGCCVGGHARIAMTVDRAARTVSFTAIGGEPPGMPPSTAVWTDLVEEGTELFLAVSVYGSDAAACILGYEGDSVSGVAVPAAEAAGAAAAAPAAMAAMASTAPPIAPPNVTGVAAVAAVMAGATLGGGSSSSSSSSSSSDDDEEG